MAKKSDDSSLQNQFLTLLTDLRSPKETASFLREFLSDSELNMLAKRLEILKLLHQNWSYEEIQNKLKVSSATISSMAQCKDSPASQVAIKKIALDEWAQSLLNKFAQLFS